LALKKDLAEALASDLPPTSPEKAVQIGSTTDGTWAPKPQRALGGTGGAAAAGAAAGIAPYAAAGAAAGAGGAAGATDAPPASGAAPTETAQPAASDDSTQGSFLELGAGFDPVIKGVKKIKVSLAPGYTDLMDTLMAKLKPASADDTPFQFKKVSELCRYPAPGGNLVAVELWNGKSLEAPVQACYEAPAAPDAPLKGHPTNAWMTAKAADACSGHGACAVMPLSENLDAERNPYASSCKCQPGFVGKACQAVCPIGTNTKGCSGHGMCHVKGLPAPAAGAAAGAAGAAPTAGAAAPAAAASNSSGSLLELLAATGDADSSDLAFTSTEAVCTCEPAYIGATCGNKKCPLGPNDKMCSGDGHGECINPDGICKCKLGWIGAACDVECPMHSSEPCGGESRGTCSKEGATPSGGGFKAGTCKCNTKDGIRGNRCQIDCPRAHSKICNGKGVCGDDGNCKCKEAFVVGHACQLECARHGPIICGHGTCDSKTGECTCKTGFMGNACGQKETDLRAIYCKGGVMVSDGTAPDELKKYGNFCGKEVRAPSLAAGDECTVAHGCPPTLDGKTRYCVNVAKKGSNQLKYGCRDCLPGAPMADCACTAGQYCVKDKTQVRFCCANDCSTAAAPIVV
jgi:hypothetical protein